MSTPVRPAYSFAHEGNVYVGILTVVTLRPEVLPLIATASPTDHDASNPTTLRKTEVV